MIKVFVVILSWQRANDTIDCINSLLKSKVDGIELEVVVVDNGSKDESVEELKKLKTKEIKNLKIIENKENLGFAGGNNVGIRYALKYGADYVMVLNNDTEVDKDLLSNLVSFMEKNASAGVASPKVYFYPGFEFHKDRYKKEDLGRVIWYAGGDVDWRNVYGTNCGVDEVDKGQYDETRETGFVTGACMFVKVKTLKKVGLFDERYYLYLEDADLSMRIKKSGLKVLYVPYAHLWHKVSQSSAIGSDLNDYFITRNRLLFGMKYAPLRTKFALFRESISFLFNGRNWQKVGVKDYYLGRFGKGSWR